MTTAAQGTGAVDAAALGGWLAEHAPGYAGPLTIDLLAGGRSNLTYRLEDAAGNRYALRRPPLGDLVGSAHDVGREYLIVSSLGATDVPVAPVVGSCPDPGVIGAPFFVMRFVDGHALSTPESADVLSPAARVRAGQQLAELLTRLHAVDLEATGLAQLHRPGSFVERQLRRLMRQQDDAMLADFPLLREVHDALAAAVPAETGTGLLHGDFKIGNMLLADDGTINAVLDWELASVGDPLADVGWLVASWADDSDGTWLVPPPTTAPGFCSRDELKELYAAASGRDVRLVDYYVAFAFWRWSCINTGTRRRYLAGAMPGRTLDVGALEAQVAWQLERAAQLLAGLAR
jgi:aminoglycoside phosphotransferase (APT) family kinase protein